MQDETQLATVFTRELAHVIHRHTLRLKSDEKARADVMAWVGVGASVSQYGGTAKLLAQAFSLSSAMGFPHALEVTADQKGLALVAAAGYDVREAPAFFQGTVDYIIRSAPSVSKIGSSSSASHAAVRSAWAARATVPPPPHSWRPPRPPRPSRPFRRLRSPRPTATPSPPRAGPARRRTD